MKKRIIAFALCLVMLLGCLGMGIMTDDKITVTIESSDGNSLNINSALTLTAAGLPEDAACQWQILIPGNGDVWVNIQGQTGPELKVTYAMVASLLYDDAASLRCVASGDFGSVASDAFDLTLDRSVDVQNPAPVKKPAAQSAGNAYGVAPMNDPEDPPANYNIIINYVFENNATAADPYTASLAAGSNFILNVTFPNVLGYLPYIGDKQQNSINKEYANIQEDDIITVTYKPTLVNYTVVYYQQNLNDDNYTEFERETKQALTNSQVPEINKDYAGFTRLMYERPNVAADGSTLVEVYYDRNYYLMNFDMDGGYGTEPVYARYGANIGTPATPTRAGYTFQGWSLNGTNIVNVPTTMPAENRTYKAIWKANDTAKVSVVFWGENANDEEYSYIGSAQVDAKPGEEFTYNQQDLLICGKEEHTHKDAECGLDCKHQHDKTCYGIASNAQPANPSDNEVKYFNQLGVENGFIYRYKDDNKFISHTDNCYIRLDGKYYKYSSYDLALGYCGGENGHTSYQESSIIIIKTTYDIYKYQVKDKCSHTHDDACYTCGKEAHTHGPSCYVNNKLDSALWKFVKSDTVTVAADGSSVVNVYYDRIEITLKFNYNYSSRKYNNTETITAKWGSDISAQFMSITENADSSFWTAEYNGEGPYTNYIGVMPESNATYYNRGKKANSGTMTYYGESLNGGEEVMYRVYNVGGYTVTDEDRYKFDGFTYDHGSNYGDNCGGAEFHYKRNSYNLTFNNGYADVKIASVKYQAPLKDYYFTPDEPDVYEPGSVTFGGWYLNPECSGAEYVLSDRTMPSSDMILYAKWVPVNHAVKFYLDKDAWEKGTELDTHPEITVPHGSLAENVENPKNGNYTFVGWFYMDNGVEKAFDFANMPVRKDLQVYGKWSSNVLMVYTIHYVYKDNEGNEIQIADDTVGSALAGTTKTFSAKGGTELYTEYQEGYFPETQSHSMTMDITGTPENGKNEYTFVYVQKEAVPYTVKYLEKDTNKELLNDKVVEDNRKAVVTETADRIPGYLPDAYQKRLIVSTGDDAENVIIFYYTKDEVHAYYTITHYTKNLDGNGWTEYNRSEAVGTIGETYSAEPINIPGFTYDPGADGTLTSGKLTANGLDLKLYYTRNEYPYQVRYLEQGTNKVLNDPKDGAGKYQQMISETAVDISGYEVVGALTQSISIQVEDSETPTKNIITFYYKEKTVDIDYKMVNPDGSISDKTSEDYGNISSAADLAVKVISGDVNGSTAKATSNVYKFVGWYKDEACTQPVDESWVTDGKITPKQNESGLYEAATYYAKFEYNLTTMTITKTVNGSTYDEDDVFVFEVVHNGATFTVSMKAGESVTLSNMVVGQSYTVRELTQHTRYTVNNANYTGTVQPNGATTVTFTNTLENNKWLGDSNSKLNVFNSPAAKP